MGKDACVNFDALFAKKGIDHLRPGGDYIGCRAIDMLEAEEDLNGGALPLNLQVDANGLEDTRETVDADEHNDADYFPEELNPPTVGNDNPLHYLFLDGKNHNKLDVSRILGGFSSARKVTMRPLRAQGISRNKALGKLDRAKLLNNNPSGGVTTRQIKAGDPGGVLVRVGKFICLAVVEVLNFWKGTYPKLHIIDVKDLDAAYGSALAITVAVQILELVPFTTFRNDDDPKDSDHSSISWATSENYIRIESSKDAALSQKHFAMRVHGTFFYPLAAKVFIPPGNESNDADLETIVWAIPNSDLLDILEIAWTDLKPDGTDILTNVKILPEVVGPGLPYTLPDGTPQLFRSDFYNTEPKKLKAKDNINCRLCGASIQLNSMRKHVGQHILRARREYLDEGITVCTSFNEPFILPKIRQIGLHPCGWCGLEGCKTQPEIIKFTGKSSKITSNCPYHYTSMIYSKAIECREASPCTNVPLNCPICPHGLGNQQCTFWKYNFLQHMTSEHLTENGTLPNCPVQLVVESHLTLLEELLTYMVVGQNDHMITRTLYKSPLHLVISSVVFSFLTLRIVRSLCSLLFLFSN